MSLWRKLVGFRRGTGQLHTPGALLDWSVANVERTQGKDHLETIGARNDLAAAYLGSGRVEDAVLWFERALTDAQRILGSDHPDTLVTEGNLAAGYLAAGRVDEAVALFEKTVTDRARVLGELHESTLAARNGLARAYHAVGDVTRSVALFEQIAADQELSFGEDHPRTRAARRDLARASASGELPARAVGPAERSGRRHKVRPLVFVVALVVLAVLGFGWAARSWWTGSGSDGGGSFSVAGEPFPADSLPAVPGSQPCTTVRVLASYENRPMLDALATAYQGAKRNAAGHCVTLEVSVQRSGIAAQDAANGFPQQAVGDRPSVWAPDSSSWLAIARQAADQASQRVIVPAQAPQATRTPIVLAMAKPQAEASGWLQRPPTWQDYLAAASDAGFWANHGHPEWGAFRVGRTSPVVASSGLYGLALEYGTVLGHPGTLDTAQVADPRTRSMVSQAERAVVHYMASEEHFFWHIRQAEDDHDIHGYVSSVTSDEKAIWDYDRGIISKDGITRQQVAPPATPLVPVYPRDGTYYVDNPMAVLDGSWVDANERAAAADFIQFAQTQQGQAVVRANGYRDLHGQADPQVAATGNYGNIATLAAFPQPTADVLAAVRNSFLDVRKRARVLFLIDVSGSMVDRIADGETKIQAAESAIVASLGYFAPDDQVGLAAFSNTASSTAVTPGLLDPVSALGTKQSGLVAKIRNLRVVDQTPLYRAVIDYSAMMGGPDYDPNKINAVVLLTDGQNNSNDPTTEAQMDAALTGLENQDRDVMVFTLAYGQDASKPLLEHISELTHAHFYDASDPTQVSAVLGDLVTSF